MKIPQPLQFQTEDFPDLKPSVLTVFNTFLRQVRDGLANQLTLTQNNAAAVKSLDVTTTDIWQQPTYTNSWADLSGARFVQFYRGQDGRVNLEGTMTNAGGAGLSAFTLPAGYRPGQLLRFLADTTAGSTRVTVDTDGTVVPVAGATNVSLNLSFAAADPVPPANMAPLTFAHGLRGRCTDLVLTAIREKTSGNPVYTPAVTPDWEDNGNGTVTVWNMGGLAPLKTYACRFLCLSEPA